MKKLFTMRLGLLFCILIGMHAQAANNDVVLTDKEGKIISDNTTIHVNQVESDPFNAEQKIMPLHLYVHNASGKNQLVTLSYRIDKMVDASLEVCFKGDCMLEEAPGAYAISNKLLPGNTTQKEALDIKLLFPTKGEATVTLQLLSKEQTLDGTAVEKKGSKLTLVFNSETTDISGATSQKPVCYNVFTLQGHIVCRNATDFQQLQSGTYIVQEFGEHGVIGTRKQLIP